MSQREERSLLPSPSPEAVTPQRGSSETASSAQRPESRYLDSKSTGEAKESTRAPATSSNLKTSISAAAAGVANAVPTSSADLQAELSKANAQIAKLKQQVESSTGLRQRKTDSSGDSKEKLATAMGVQNAPAGGVPVQIVAGLCLLSFLLAYFLF